MYAFIKLYEFSCSSNMRILVILGSPRDLVCTLLFKKKKKKKKKERKKKEKIMQELKLVTRSYLEASLACVKYECLNFLSMDLRS